MSSLLSFPAAIRNAVGNADMFDDGHARRVARLAAAFAAALGCDKAFVEAIGLAALLHDIGEADLPRSVMRKIGLFTEAEQRLMRGHCAAGSAMLADRGDPVLDMASRIALFHHEAMDGSGYPNRVVGDAIPLEARIVAVCDVYDALRQRRSYKPGMSHTSASQVILRGDARTMPRHFCPEVVTAFGEIQVELERVFDAASEG